MTTIGGAFLLAVSVLYLAFKLKVAYDAAADPRGAGGVPTLDAVIFAPIFAIVGVAYLFGEMPVVRAVTIWAVMTAGTVGALWAVQAIGKQRR